MRKSLLFIMLCACISLQAQAADQGVTWVASTSVQSEYLGRIGPIFSEDPISVNFVEVGYKGFYGGIWNSTSLGGSKYGTTYGDEWDVYGGWAHKFGPFKLDLSASYFTLAQLNKISDDMWIAEQELSIPGMPFVQPYIRARYFGSVDDYWRSGWFVFGGLRKSVPFGHSFASRPFSLNIDVSTAYAAGGIRDFTGFVKGRLTTSLDIPLSKRVTLSPNLIYQVAAPGQRNDPNGFVKGNDLVYGLSLKWIF